MDQVLLAVYMAAGTKSCQMVLEFLALSASVQMLMYDPSTCLYKSLFESNFGSRFRSSIAVALTDKVNRFFATLVESSCYYFHRRILIM